jgi:hypothetical protein
MTPTQIKYAIIAVGFLAWTASAFLFGGRVKDLSWRAEMAKQADAANALYVDALNRNAALEAANSLLARTVDETHAKALSDAAASRDDFTKRLRVAASRARCANTPSGEAPNPGIGSDPAGSSDGQYRGPDIEAGGRLRDYAISLQAYAKACHSWATSVGK